MSSALRPRAPLLRSLSSAAPLAVSLTQSLTEWKEVLQPGGIVFALLAAGAVSARYFVDTRVAAKMEALTLQMASQSVALEALSKAVDAKNAVIQREVDAKTAGVQKEVDAKTAGLASSVQKEVDAKTVGLQREVDAKFVSLVRELESRMGGIVAAAGNKAEAETLRVFKEYKVRSLSKHFPLWRSCPAFLTLAPTPTRASLLPPRFLWLEARPASESALSAAPQPFTAIYLCAHLFMFHQLAPECAWVQP